MAKTAHPLVDDPEASPAAQLEETLRRMIAERAYYRAEQRGFEPGHDYEDWLEAEREIREGQGLL